MEAASIASFVPALRQQAVEGEVGSLLIELRKRARGAQVCDGDVPLPLHPAASTP